LRKQPAAAAPPATVEKPTPHDKGHSFYDDFVHDLAQWARTRILDRLKESTVLSERAKLIDSAVSLAGIASADWYLTTEIASAGDGGGPGLAGLLRRRTESGIPLVTDEFLAVTVVCTFFHLFAVMADRDRYSAARTFVVEIGAPAALAEMAHELERAYPTRRVAPRPPTTLAAYLALADELLAEHLGVNNGPGLSAAQAATVTQQFRAFYLNDVLPVLQQVS
jgi:hypothetical protein